MLDVYWDRHQAAEKAGQQTTGVRVIRARGIIFLTNVVRFYCILILLQRLRENPSDGAHAVYWQLLDKRHMDKH